MVLVDLVLIDTIWVDSVMVDSVLVCAMICVQGSPAAEVWGSALVAGRAWVTYSE